MGPATSSTASPSPTRACRGIRPSARSTSLPQRCARGATEADRAPMRIAILGVGLIGGSIGLAARENAEDVDGVGFGRSRERLELARELGAIDVAADSLEDALDGADACFACAPVGVLPE